MKIPPPFFLTLVLLFTSITYSQAFEKEPTIEVIGYLQKGSSIEARFQEDMVSPKDIAIPVKNTPFVITPPLAGETYWKNPKTLCYKINASTRPQSTYKISLNTLTSLEGSAYASKKPGVFKTPPFSSKMLRQFRANSTRPKVILEFNDTLDLKSAKERTFFISKSKTKIPAVLRHAKREDVAKDQPLEHTLAIEPLVPLPPSDQWNLELSQGIASADASYKTRQSIKYSLGAVREMGVSYRRVVNHLDIDRSITIAFTKDFHEAVTPEFLHEWISLDPQPRDFKIQKSSSNQLKITGDFYRTTSTKLTIQSGFLASDDTVMKSPYTDKIVFKNFGPYIGMGPKSETQLSMGRRTFDLLAGNLRQLRIQVKAIAPENKLYALKGYERYQKELESEKDGVVPFEMVAAPVIFDKTYETEIRDDKSDVWSLDWNHILGENMQGTLFVHATGTDKHSSKTVTTQAIIQLTDIGFVWKNDREDWLLYAFSNETGMPIPHATIEAWDAENKVLFSTETDPNGLVTMPKNKDLYWITAKTGSDHYALHLREKAKSLPLHNYPVSVRQQLSDDVKKRKCFLFIDRPLYRNGETVYLKGITRFANGKMLSMPGAQPASITVSDHRGKVFHRAEAAITGTGSFNHQFTLPESGLGYYNIRVRFNGNDRNQTFYQNFRVEDFRPNTFEITSTPPPSLSPDATVAEVPFHAAYLMGKALSKVPVNYTTSVTSRGFSSETFEDFDFISSSSPSSPTKTRAEGNATLDLKGNATISVAIPPHKKTTTGPRTLSINAEITDINQQTITHTVNVPVHGSAFYLGVRKGPSDEDKTDNEGDSLTFDIVAADTEGNAWDQPGVATWRIEKHNWNSVRVQSAGGSLSTRNFQTTEVLEEGSCHWTPDQPGNISWKASEPGRMDLIVETKDAEDRLVQTRYEFYVYGADRRIWWRDTGTAECELVPDKELYQPGEIASILVKTPFTGQALVTVESEAIHHQFVTKIEKGMHSISIPITELEAPNAYVSVMMIRGAVDSPHQVKMPSWRLGFCRLNVDTSSQKLSVSIDSSIKSWQPGEMVELTLKVRDDLDQPVADSEVTLCVVDQGILDLVSHSTPDPTQSFFGTRGLEVHTGLTIPQLYTEDPDLQSFGNKGYIIGGGSAGPSPTHKREIFKATAHWDASLKTGAQGTVIVRFKAPDNLTTFKVIAIATAGIDQFGSGDSQITIHQPLMLEPALPRFANVGDNIVAKAIVHNSSDTSGTFKVTLRLMGSTTRFPNEAAGFANEQTKTIDLKKGASGSLRFPIAFEEVGEAHLEWAAEPVSLDQPSKVRLADAVVSKFTVQYPLPLLRSTQFVTLRKDRNQRDFLEGLDRNLLKGKGTLKLRLSESPLMETQGAVDYLLRYPYGCVEQTTSSTLPWIATKDLREHLPTLNKSDEDFQAALEKGTTRLLSMQTDDGGLAYWPGGKKSLFWGSAYGGMGLTLAARAGVNLPSESMNALYQYLSKQLRSTDKNNKASGIDRAVDRSLALFSLAVAGRPEHAYHTKMFEHRKELPKPAQLYLAMAILQTDKNQGMAETILQELRDAKDEDTFSSYRGHNYVYGLNLMAQSMLSVTDGESEKLTKKLLQNRNSTGHWGSTWSNIWALFGFAEFVHASARDSEPGIITFTWNGEERETEVTNSVEIAIPFEQADSSLPLNLQNQTDTEAYAQLELEAYPERVPMRPVDKGMKLERTYQKLAADGSLSKASNLEVGDLVLVTLAMDISDKSRYIVVDDALPSIFEAINPTFKTQEVAKPEAPEAKIEGKTKPLFCNHRELRKNRALFFCDYLYSGGKYALQYVARVIAEGQVTAPAAKIERMYAPDVYGLSASEVITSGNMDDDLANR